MPQPNDDTALAENEEPLEAEPPALVELDFPEGEPGELETDEE